MRGKSSGITLTNSDARIALGMSARNDREHDIAAWFGVNQGRIAEIKTGSHGELVAASADQLPPKGPPGVKGRRLLVAVKKANAALDEKGPAALEEVKKLLAEAQARYEANEA